ncbi:hypothetical protein R6Q57_000019 [Mikania cordata]
MANKDGVGIKTTVIEAPPTPGRPLFSFSASRKNFPSKWDDAEKWLIGGPVHGFVKSPDFVSTHTHCGNHHKTAEEKVLKAISVYQDHLSPSDVLLKDKITNSEEREFSRFKCVKEEFVFSSMQDASTEVITASRCPTPYKSVSPPRHNTPASMSGPLAFTTSFDLQECHLAKLQPSVCNWSSREEEEEDVSKSLRHFECPKSIPKPTTCTCAWEQEQNARSHAKYQREDAKIQAWVNLENAKAEAQSRKLEVKIQKMRSKFEEKMMKRMASVHRKAEELRATALYDHKMHPRKPTMESKELHESLHFSGSCGCFPCSPRHL